MKFTLVTSLTHELRTTQNTYKPMGRRTNDSHGVLRA